MEVTQREGLTSCTELAIVGPLSTVAPKLSNKIPFIYLDGGLRHKELIAATQLESYSFAIGDNDSFEGDIDLFDKLLPAEKDYSDFGAALRVLKDRHTCPQNIEVIHLYGLLGERLDHQLAIFGEIIDFLKQTRHNQTFKAKLYPNSSSKETNEVVTLFKGLIEENFEGIFSVMAIAESSEITLHGDLKYPIENHKMAPFSSHGLSNQAHGEIQISSTKPALFIRTDG
jgi:thiamine pyrophosphokinase